MPASNVTVSATFTGITDVFTTAEAVLTITFNTTNGTSTVNFTRESNGSYSYACYGVELEGCFPHASENNGIITISVSWNEDNGETSYTLKIDTTKKSYTENGSAVLQTIGVNGTNVTLTKK